MTPDTVSGGDTLDTLPVMEIIGRRYAWKLGNTSYGSGSITGVARCEDRGGLVAFYTDNRCGELTFAMSREWASWRRNDNNDIVMVPRQKDGGVYIFYSVGAE